MKNTIIVLLIALMSVTCGLTGSLAAQGAEEAVPAAPAQPPSKTISAEKSNNLVVVAGVPQVLLWARGLQNPEEVEAYAEARLNTLYVAVPRAEEQALAQAEAILAVGEEVGLPAVIGLDSRAARIMLDDGREIAAHPRAATYQRNVRLFINTVAPRLKGRGSVIGWVIEGLSPQSVVGTDEDFQNWLEDNYQDIASLNQSWHSGFRDFSEIALLTPAQVDAPQTAGLGRAMMDLGLYNYWLYRGLVELWANELRRADASRLLILGDQADFRSLATIPDTYSGIVTRAVQTTPAAQGGFTGIEAIDLARRTNTFAAFAFADAQTLSSDTLYAWAGECLVHGAAGIAFDGWQKINRDTGLKSALARLSELTASANVFPRTPRAQSAILYEPFSGGPGYGFLPIATSQEPGALFAAFARGTRYGLVDYLTEDMLVSANLSRYGVIFAPLALTVSPNSQQALINYVTGGGVLVADWGIGLYQSGTLNAMPDSLSALFGAGFTLPVVRTPMNISVLSPDPLFPSLPFQAMTSGQQAGGAFAGLLGDVKVMGAAKRFMTMQAFGTYAPTILLNQVGAGYAIFASAPLWENWRRGDALFDGFHGDLIARNRNLVAGGGSGLFAPVDVSRYDDGAVGLFRGADAPLPTQVQITGDGTRVYEVRSGYQIIGSPRPSFAFTGAGANLAVPLPMQINLANGNDRGLLQVKEYSLDAIVLEVRGPGAAFASEDGAAKVEGGGDFNATLSIPSFQGGYSFASGSRHRVTVRDLTGAAETRVGTVTASGGRALSVPITGRQVEVRIEPAGASD